MISGFLGDENAILFQIEFIASDGLILPVDAMLDTGFSAYLAINNQDIDALGWTYIKQEPMSTARGEAEFKLYLGRVQVDGQEFEIPVHVGEDLPEVLFGRQWLANRRLIVDMLVGELTLG
ncbi:MAG: aspartyl protease [Nostocaceae cyanobacterium]|nr:aspartyl protease [Nostocaceae cyanobacterium]